MDTAARRRMADGQSATAEATGRLESRAADLLRAALRTEEAARTRHAARVLAAPPAPLHSVEPTPTTPGGHPPAAGASTPAGASSAVSAGRVERALALLERIERFVRSGRPSLALTLRGAVPGQLELQRVGPGTIALRLSSPRPPPESELAELRRALEARGLSVRTLEARRLTASGADACSPCP